MLSKVIPGVRRFSEPSAVDKPGDKDGTEEQQADGAPSFNSGTMVAKLSSARTISDASLAASLPLLPMVRPTRAFGCGRISIVCCGEVSIRVRLVA